VAIKKKHNMEKAIEQAQGWFTKEAIARPQEYADNMVKLLTKSSMVSLFEKPKFRDFVKSLSLHEKKPWPQACTISCMWMKSRASK
jgi:hypothetical protein